MAETPSWLEIPLGTRLTVRCRLAQGGYADSIGYLVKASPDELVLNTRHGQRTIQAAEIGIVHVIKPTRTARLR